MIAAQCNVRYGWDYNGILVPGLLAVAWYSPLKLVTTFVEAMAVDQEGGLHISYLRHEGTDNFADTSIRYAYRPPGDRGVSFLLITEIRHANAQ